MTPVNKHNQSGLTLIELLVASVLGIILMTGVLGLQYILAKNREVAIDNYYAVDTANVNLTGLVREIRTARQSETGSYPIASAQDNELIFYSDIDFDQRIERVRYSLDGDTLEKGIVEPTGQPVSYDLLDEKVKILSSSVNNLGEPLFTYYNGDWPVDTANNPLSSPPNLSAVKLVKIYLNIASSSDSDNEYVLESFAAIRMLKDNL